MLESNMAAILDPKWLPFRIIFIRFVASRAFRNLIVAARHMFSGMRNTFL